MHKVTDPSTQLVYRRYIQTIGVDIAESDNSIFKNTNNPLPSTFTVLRFPDLYHDQDENFFTDPYVVQQSTKVSAKNLMETTASCL